MDKMVIVRKHGNNEEMCFVLNRVLEINKENTEIIKTFSELLKVNKAVNGVDEEFFFRIYPNDASNSMNYFNGVLKGEYKNVKEGSLYDFLILYINKYYRKYANIPGYTIVDKMEEIIKDHPIQVRK